MKINRYVLHSGKLLKLEVPSVLSEISLQSTEENWFEIEAASTDELSSFLIPLQLHPLQLKRCLDAVDDPGVFTFDGSLLMEYQAAFEKDSDVPAYLTILLIHPVL